MTSTDSPLNLDLDLALLLADARTFLALGPYVATFVLESLGYLRRRRLARGSLGIHAKAIEQSRHSLKFLDDSERGVSGVLACFERMGAASCEIFVGSHKGVLGPLKRLIQSDLSIFVDQGRMIGTSDSVMVQQLLHRERIPTTLEEFRSFGPELRERSFAIGQYIVAVLTAFNMNADTEISSTLPPSKGVDAKGNAFYGSLLRAKASGGVGLAMLITSLLSSTNFVLHVLPSVSGSGPIDSCFVSKWRLITLFHVCSSLQRIAASQQEKDVLRPDVLNAIVELRRDFKFVEKLKPLRDALVHYDLGKPSKRTRETAVERLTRYMRSDASAAGDALAEVSVTLTRLLPPVR
jgi:hypothetical protein